MSEKLDIYASFCSEGFALSRIISLSHYTKFSGKQHIYLTLAGSIGTYIQHSN